MKMVLTRLGFRSRMVVTGDMTQTDLPVNQQSGLAVALKILQHVEGIALCEFSQKDVVRHPLVQRIVSAYEQYEQ
jgi:phosphate starvation-inducible PhoH-like protein